MIHQPDILRMEWDGMAYLIEVTFEESGADDPYDRSSGGKSRKYTLFNREYLFIFE